MAGKMEITIGEPKISEPVVVQTTSQHQIPWTILAVIDDLGRQKTLVELGSGLSKEEVEDTSKLTDLVSGLKLPGVWSAKLLACPTQSFRNFLKNVCIRLKDVKVTDQDTTPPERQLEDKEGEDA